MTTEFLLREIFGWPTAPFRESWIQKVLVTALERKKIPYFFDNFGNLIAGTTRAKIKTLKTGIAFFAHTDHPGFHVQEKLSPRTYQALWLGGAPFDTMMGAKVRIHSPTKAGWNVKGKITKFDPQAYTRQGMLFEIELAKDVSEKDGMPEGAFGAFDFPGAKIKGTKVTTRCADDLAGCVIALGALMDNWPTKKGLAIFTRAEEVGFVGCMGLLESGLLPKTIACVSLEASKTLPGAIIGEGPVLRLGDKASLFDSDLSNALHVVAQKLLKDEGVKFQRRIMDGGTCEGTAIRLYGYKTTGLAVPLGNYHNQGKKGPAPEIVDMRDVESGRRICAKMMEVWGTDEVWTSKIFQTSILKEFQGLKKLLKDYPVGELL